MGLFFCFFSLFRFHSKFVHFDPSQIVEDSSIVTACRGATTLLKVKSFKGQENQEVLSIPCFNNSGYIMGGKFQRNYQHGKDFFGKTNLMTFSMSSVYRSYLPYQMTDGDKQFPFIPLDIDFQSLEVSRLFIRKILFGPVARFETDLRLLSALSPLVIISDPSQDSFWRPGLQVHDVSFLYLTNLHPVLMQGIGGRVCATSVYLNSSSKDQYSNDIIVDGNECVIRYALNNQADMIKNSFQSKLLLRVFLGKNASKRELFLGSEILYLMDGIVQEWTPLECTIKGNVKNLLRNELCGKFILFSIIFNFFLNFEQKNEWPPKNSKSENWVQMIVMKIRKGKKSKISRLLLNRKWLKEGR